MGEGRQELIEVTEDNIMDILERYPLIVIECRASVCSPCTVMERESLKPIIRKITEKYHGRVVFGRVVIDRNPEIARRFDVRSSMTFLLFRYGRLVDRIVGIKVKNVLENKIREILSEK